MAAIAGATYSVRFECQAFEPDGGRSVKAFSNRVLVSPLEFAVGYKPDGELRYIQAGAEKMVNLLAVNPQLQRVDLADVAFEVRETYYVSILKEQRGGDFAYQSVKRERVVSSGKLDISQESGFDISLPTDAPGEFSVQLKDGDENLLSRFGYSVVGKGNRSRSLDDNAELFVKLAKPDWRRGEEIEMSITAPFVGTGLITIERDKVYAHKFFTTDTTSSVQTIRVPDELEGTAYVNVTFVRALDSPEIFMSPLSYAVAPFRIANDRRELTVELNPVEEARPGKPLRIPYKADRNCKIAIFAVDEGILQVTRFETPEPLPHFQRKRALLVDTFQILDMLMPEYRHIQEQLPAFGGGADFHLNPFKRLTEAPVVYWSGIVDAGPDEREVVYDVPDYFDGSLRIMAVAVSRDGMGQTRADTTVVSPILINPGLLTFAAPGDTFDVSVTLANNLDEDAGDSANVSLAVEASEHLEILDQPAAATEIARGTETTLTFRAKAAENLGNGTLTFRAAAGDETSVRRATLSVRPPVPFTTMVESGYTAQQNLEAATLRELRPEFHTAKATVSVLPISLTSGLDDYLAKYPHGCTEQLVSGSFARLLLSNEADFGLTKGEVQQQIDRTCRVLRGRINNAGGFGMWYSGPTNDIDFLTIYVSHFLTEADDAGFDIPPALLRAPRQQLQKMAGVTTLKYKDYRDQAYAIYVMTLADVVTTNYVLNLRDYLSKNVEDEEWMSGPTAVYLAGTYKMLKKNDEAKKLLKGYRRAVERRTEDEDDFHKPLAQDAQYLAILTKHFPEEAKALSGEDLRGLLEPVIAGDFNTLSAAYSILALKGYSQLAEQFPMKLNIEAAVGDQIEALKVSGEKLKTAEFSRETDAIRFSAVPSEDGPSGMFYSVSEGGYEVEVPNDEIREGLEITREFLDASGNPVSEAAIGESLTVRLRLRSLKPNAITNVAIVDLLPGGFEVVRESLPAGRSKLPGIDFNEVREDRVVLFGIAPTKIQTLKYEVTPTRRGEFVIPPILADSMYDRSVRARGAGGKILVK
ncbi:MAG: alpha-2-macroglobulin family protein [Verrucomicrobiota bacterium]